MYRFFPTDDPETWELANLPNSDPGLITPATWNPTEPETTNNGWSTITSKKKQYSYPRTNTQPTTKTRRTNRNPASGTNLTTTGNATKQHDLNHYQFSSTSKSQRQLYQPGSKPAPPHIPNPTSKQPTEDQTPPTGRANMYPPSQRERAERAKLQHTIQSQLSTAWANAPENNDDLYAEPPTTTPTKSPSPQPQTQSPRAQQSSVTGSTPASPSTPPPSSPPLYFPPSPSPSPTDQDVGQHGDIANV